MTIFPPNETRQMLAGPVGELEMVVCATPSTPRRGVGVVCHPHPLFGGTMSNKVVTTVFKAFLETGYDAVRFNYRGVGASAGKFAEGIGETDDCLSILQWLDGISPAVPIVLVGFSFGAYVATRASLAAPTLPKALITIAPPVNHFDFAAFPVITSPWTVIIAENDDIVPAAEIHNFVRIRQENILAVDFPQTSHFFHGQLIALKDKICGILTN